MNFNGWIPSDTDRWYCAKQKLRRGILTFSNHPFFILYILCSLLFQRCFGVSLKCRRNRVKSSIIMEEDHKMMVVTWNIIFLNGMHKTCILPWEFDGADAPLMFHRTTSLKIMNFVFFIVASGWWIFLYLVWLPLVLYICLWSRINYILVLIMICYYSSRISVRHFVHNGCFRAKCMKYVVLKNARFLKTFNKT